MQGGARILVGLALAGYGILIVAGVLPHDALLAGAASLLLGLALLAPGLPLIRLQRGRIVAALGACAVVGVLAYNAATHSDLSVPEWGILLYGVALLLAAPFLSRPIGKTDVSTLVGWSFPILLAPLAVYSLNAGLSAGPGATAAAPVVQVLIVWPSAFLLRLFGTAAAVVGSDIIVPTERGPMRLAVGLVCAGLYPMILFGGLVGVHAWRERTPPKRLALIVGTGLLGLWLVNLFRILIITKVGQRWGVEALLTVHANLGWILFAAYMLTFWYFVVRVRAPTLAPPAPAPVRDA